MDKKKVLTEEEKKYEQQLEEEHDLARLQRQYEIMERGRMAFSEDVGIKIAKQRKVLGIFKKEQQNILLDLSIATAKIKKKEDLKTSTQLQNVLQDYGDYDAQIKTKKAYLKELDGQIYVKEREVVELESKQITDRQFYDRVSLARKTVEKLENKLEVQIRKFCTICYENKLLRSQIDSLIGERDRFNKTWDKLIKNLTTGKKFMLDLIEQATIAYDQREEWVSKVQSLKKRAQSELINHIQNMRELERKRDNDGKLKEFIMIKGQRRLMLDLELKEKNKRRVRLANISLQVDNYRSVMEEIFNFTNEREVETIVKNFLHQESINFSRFKFINELNKEMEILNENIVELHLDIDEMRNINEMRRESQMEKLCHLREDFETYKEKTKASTDELKNCEQKLSQIITGVEYLFKLLKCGNDPLLNLLGKNNKINYYNILLYLEILESNVQEYIISLHSSEKNLFDKKKLKKEHMVIRDEGVAPRLVNINLVVSTNPCPLCVEHELVHDVIDSLQKVKSKDEVKEALKARLLLPDGADRLHNVSTCHLPKSREIMQKRYQ